MATDTVKISDDKPRTANSLQQQQPQSFAAIPSGISNVKAAPEQLSPGAVRALQGMVGNQVVQRMLYGSKPAAPVVATQSPTVVARSPMPRMSATGDVYIQRKMNFRADALLRNRNTKKTFSQRLGKENTWDKLMRVLDDYSNTQKASEEVALLTTMRGLAVRWLTKYDKAKKSTATDAQIVVIHRLLSAINAELPHAEEEASYMESLMDGLDTGKNTKYGYLTGSGAMDAPDHAQKLSSGQTGKDKTVGFGTAALQTVQKYKLTDAEIAAIKIYSAEDYKYINPSMAARGHLAFKNNDNTSIKGLHGWLNSNLESESQSGTPATPEQRFNAKGEGRTHGRMVMRGLTKLPDFKGSVYRGMTVASGELSSRYQVGQVIDYPNFTSSSKNIAVAEKFITRELQKAVSSGDAKSGVLLVVQLKRGGKDVSDISLVQNEAEVLWLPGQRIQVTKIIPQTQTGKNYTIVEATQVGPK